MRFLSKSIVLVVLVALAGGLLLGRYWSSHTALDDAAARAIKLHLAGDYAQHIAGDPERGLIDKGKALLKLDSIELVSLTALGDAADMVVRVQVQVDGEPPPDGRPVRYFRMDHAPVSGWTVAAEVNALSYYLNLL